MSALRQVSFDLNVTTAAEDRAHESRVRLIRDEFRRREKKNTNVPEDEGWVRAIDSPLTNARRSLRARNAEQNLRASVKGVAATLRCGGCAPLVFSV